MRNDVDRREPSRITFAFREMAIDDACATAAWRYDPPYDFYNGDNAEQIADVPAGFASATVGGELAGFFCFGAEARVPGCEQHGCYRDEALDIELGLRPDLTDRGYGLAFVRAGLGYAMERFVPRAVRLTVATFNDRAIRAYERAGFVRGERCLSPVRGVAIEFEVMHRPRVPVERELDALSR